MRIDQTDVHMRLTENRLVIVSFQVDNIMRRCYPRIRCVSQGRKLLHLVGFLFVFVYNRQVPVRAAPFAYIPNSGSSNVSVIDVAGRKEITRIKVGQIPKRNATGIFPVIGAGGTN